jgi:hypothetical protein
MTEKQYETALLALGCENVTTQSQAGNGTTAFQLPTGQVVSEHQSGYIRRNMYRENKGVGGRCYQLNPTYNVPHQVIGHDGKLHRYEGAKRRTLIYSRKTRLKKLFLYAIKKLNNG